VISALGRGTNLGAKQTTKARSDENPCVDKNPVVHGAVLMPMLIRYRLVALSSRLRYCLRPLAALCDGPSDSTCCSCSSRCNAAFNRRGSLPSSVYACSSLPRLMQNPCLTVTEGLHSGHCQIQVPALAAPLHRTMAHTLLAVLSTLNLLDRSINMSRAHRDCYRLALGSVRNTKSQSEDAATSCSTFVCLHTNIFAAQAGCAVP
jgi:hypothetical protein